MATASQNNQRPLSDSYGTPIVVIRLAESFENVVASNPHLRLEQTADGAIVIMTPTGGGSGRRNAHLIYQLQRWAEEHGGVVFDSSTLFRLPNGAKRSPDASWVDSQRWSSLSSDDRDSYPPICPDFVIELRSETDQLGDLTAKMQEYLDNGARLGWLIDPLRKQVHIYRPAVPPSIMSDLESIASDGTLPGFELDLRPIWRDA